MRICFLSRSDVVHPQSGGMETQGKLLTEGLAAIGHEVVMITGAHPEGALRLDENGVVKYFLAGVPSVTYSTAWWQESVRQFAKLHQEKPFDIVLSQSVSGWGYLRARRQYGVPCVAIMHGTTFRDLKTRFGSISSAGDALRFVKEAALRLERYLGRWLYWFRKFDAIIAVSQAVRGSLIKNYFLSPRRVFLVYNGIAVEKLQSTASKSAVRAELEIAPETKVILYLGRLDKEKGVAGLLTAVANLGRERPDSKIKLIIVGSGPYYNKLVYYTRELNLSETVQFVGQVPYAAVPKYYWAADVFVLPSEALEGLPMTIIEAMAAGLPVVASAIGGVPEAVVDGKTGILVEPGNAASLTKALARVLAEDGWREGLGQAARQVAAEKFSDRVMTQGTLEVLEKVIAPG